MAICAHGGQSTPSNGSKDQEGSQELSGPKHVALLDFDGWRALADLCVRCTGIADRRCAAAPCGCGRQVCRSRADVLLCAVCACARGERFLGVINITGSSPPIQGTSEAGAGGESAEPRAARATCRELSAAEKAIRKGGL